VPRTEVETHHGSGRGLVALPRVKTAHRGEGSLRRGIKLQSQSWLLLGKRLNKKNSNKVRGCLDLY
jgi:hypothetical protein